MIPPIDISSLSSPAQKIAAPGAPPKLQEMAARGIAPGIKPAELVTLLVLFSTSETVTLRDTAAKTLSALPEQILSSILGSDLPPLVVDMLARAYTDQIDTLNRILMMPRISMETVEDVARNGSERVTELIAINEERLLNHPRIIELLYLNKKTRMSTADRIVDLAIRHGITLTGLAAHKEIAAALQDELIPLADDEPTPDDVFFYETQQLAERLAEDGGEALEDPEGALDGDDDEPAKDKWVPLYKRVAEMTVSQKVRRATLGTKEERGLLVRDQNKIVASAAARSPLLQETEVAMISRNKNISDEVLRIIATSPIWLKSYLVKKNLCENPKTPVTLAVRLISQLRESDLKMLAKSKNVTGAIQETARRYLEIKSKKR